MTGTNYHIWYVLPKFLQNTFDLRKYLMVSLPHPTLPKPNPAFHTCQARILIPWSSCMHLPPYAHLQRNVLRFHRTLLWLLHPDVIDEHCVGALWWVCVSSSALSLYVLGFLLQQQPLRGGDSRACVYSCSPHNQRG